NRAGETASALENTGVRSSAGQRFARRRCVIKWKHSVADDLILLVPFTGYQYNVARTRQIDRCLDGCPSVNDGEEPLAAVAARVRRETSLNVFDDPARILAAGIIGGDDDEVAQSAGDGAHQRSLRSIAIATATKHRDQPAFGQRTRRLE